MFYIVQLCCYECKHFESFTICCSSDYTEFIRNYYKNYKDYTYLIYDKYGNDINIVEFV